MKMHRVAVASVCAVVAAAGSLFLAASLLQAQLPLSPYRDSGQGVTGSFEGWYKNPDGTFTLLVGYYNRNEKQALEIPIGPNNQIEPGGPDQGQPTHFLPQRQWGIFSITVPKDFGEKKLTWTLTANGQTSSIPLNLNPLWVVEPFKDLAMGNTPPVVKFERGGVVQQGPPREITATFETKVADAVTLTVWLTDDERQNPGVAPAPRLSATWSKFRGPAAVKFSNGKPEIDKADGKATTTATFTAPGEYILRLQANDYSGDGGGGFQCCWTTAHVKVIVRQ
jgi:hypothetical protein